MKHFALDTVLVLIALVLVGALIVRQVNVQLPDYGLAAYQAGEGWRWSMLGVDTALPYLAWLLLFGTAIGAVHAWITRGNGTETTPKPKPKRIGIGTRLRLSKPKPILALTDGGDNEPDDLRITVETLRRVGKVAKVAEQLNISTAAVNKRVRKMYEKEPEYVSSAVPEWVERNIKE